MMPDNQESQEPVLLGLFREELAELTGSLASGLSDASADISSDCINVLIRTVRTIRGAARVVGLPIAMNLAHSMEETLSQLSSSDNRLMPDQIAQLRQATEIFQSIRAQEEKSIPQWLLDHEVTINRVAQALRQTITGTQEPSSGAETDKVLEQERAVPDANTESADITEDGSIKEDSLPLTYFQEETRVPELPEEVSGIKPFYDDHVLNLAGECLVLARRLRDLEPSLRAVISDASKPTGTADWTVISENAETKPAPDTLAVFERSSQRLEQLERQLYDAILAGRAVPFADRVVDIHSEISTLAEKLGKAVQFHLRGGDTAIDPKIAEKLQKLLRLLIRRILIYSLETPAEREAAGKPPESLLSLSADSRAGILYVTLTDDGRGLHDEEMSGLDESFKAVSPAEMIKEIGAVNAFVEALDGTIHWAESPGGGTRIMLVIPAVSFYLNCFLVAIDGESYALPMARISHVTKVSVGDIRQGEDRCSFVLDGENIVLRDATLILGSSEISVYGDELSIVILRKGQTSYGLVVESFLGEERLVLQPLDARLGKVEFVRAVSLLTDGTLTLVLEMNDLLHALEQGKGRRRFDGKDSLPGSAHEGPIQDRSAENVPWPFWRRQ
ncbi:MAG: chemotaxis protein CheW [Syntrophaceae bacterium]|nr:chemotaxis protein CheW [Syntrophaceae bacterium]